MNVLLVHNRYRYRGGEDAVFETTLNILQCHGLHAWIFEKSSQTMGRGLLRKAGAVFSAIYSPASAREMKALLEQQRPDVVHSHNLFPLISPSVLSVCHKANVPVVMTCHNYRLMCPIAVHFQGGQICEHCLGGREYWCALRNCRSNRLESLAYGLRGMCTRSLGLFKHNVTRFIAISAFLKQRLVEAGFSADCIDVVYNTVAVPDTAADPAQGRYVAFAGRLSEEKGLDMLLAAAAQVPEIPVRIAGAGPLEDALKAAAPKNVSFSGMFDKAGLEAFYRGARCVVVPSRWYEAFGLVAAEAMAHGIPVLAARMGALPELVLDNETGFLFESDQPEDLAEKLRLLWNDPGLAQRLGSAGRDRAVREFNEETHFRRLAAVYEKAIAASEKKVLSNGRMNG
jgi:glycosyltransferase involved in cell wall biosynthesis